MLLSALVDCFAPILLRTVLIVLGLGLFFCPTSVKEKNATWILFQVEEVLMRMLSTLKVRSKAWMFLFRGPTMIREAYNKSNGAPFYIDVPENRYWVVSTWKHVNEINSAPETVLSLQGAAKEILQPKHTMEGFDWFEKKGADGAPLLKTIGVLLTTHLPELLPELRHSISALFDQHYDLHLEEHDKCVLPLYPIVIEAVARSNAFAFFGRELAQNETFMKAGMGMIEQTLIIAEVTRLLPNAISDFVGKFMSERLNSSKIVLELLEPVVAERFEEQARAKRGFPAPDHKDCIQWIMETSPKSRPWTVRRVVYELIALWFGSVHITSTTACFALFDLCLRPEYLELLRMEFDATGWKAFETSGGKILPLLDSFIKESARCTPVESVSTRRKALQPFQLSDGTKVKTGEWICAAAQVMGNDPSSFVRASEFHGFRFVKPEVLNKTLGNSIDGIRTVQGQKASGFTDLSDWQLWGTGRGACPGRFYASAVTKTILLLFIQKWDPRLTNPKAKQYFSWRTFIYPYANVKVSLEPRTHDNASVA